MVEICAFTVRERLPGLNEYIKAMNADRHSGNRLKRETQESIGIYIRAAMAKGTLRRIADYPVRIDFEWHEKTKKRDLDNIAHAKKYILDALQERGILDGDGQKFICGFFDAFIIPDSWDGVVVRIFGKEKNREK